MMLIKPGITTSKGWWDLSIQPDITSEEAVHLGVVLSTYVMIQRGMDLWDYVKEHNLMRHFSQKTSADVTINATKAI